MMDKLLVTGANGLLGSAICKMARWRFSSLYDVVPVTHSQCDLTDFHAIKAVFDYVLPRYVIHTAAVVGGIGSNMNHPGRFFCTNISINTNVLECARLCKVDGLISYLSTCVFPDDAVHPLRIEDIHNGPPHPSNAAYAYAKRMLDVQSRAYRTEWGCNFITLVPSNMYGENDNWDLENAHVLPSLIHKCFLAKSMNADFEVWGSGKPLREFLLSDDVARASLWILERYSKPDPLIISSGIETSISDAVQKIVLQFNFDGNIVFRSDKPDGQLSKPSDTTKFRELLPEFEFTPIDAGLKKTVDWFISYYPNVRGGISL